MTHLFRGPVHGHAGFLLSPHEKVPVCQPCANEKYGVDHIDREIAMGRMSFKPTNPSPTNSQLLLEEMTQDGNT